MMDWPKNRNDWIKQERERPDDGAARLAERFRPKLVADQLVDAEVRAAKRVAIEITLAAVIIAAFLVLATVAMTMIYG